MNALQFTDSEGATLTNALTIAAEKFDENARLCRVWGSPPATRELGDIFEQQAAEVRTLIVKIDEAEERTLIFGDLALRKHVAVGNPGAERNCNDCGFFTYEQDVTVCPSAQCRGTVG